MREQLSYDEVEWLDYLSHSDPVFSQFLLDNPGQDLWLLRMRLREARDRDNRNRCGHVCHPDPFLHPHLH